MPSATSPIAVRLYKVLAANYSDEPTRQVLQTLSELYYTPVQGYSKGKEREKDKDREDDWDSDDQDDPQHHHHHVPPNPKSDDTIPTFRELVPGESASRARKNLRKDMENKLAQSSQQFLHALSEVDQKLDILQEQIASMRRQCNEAESQLSSTSTATASLLERASVLRDQRRQVEDRKSIITFFLSRFTLSEAEAAALSSRDVPVGPSFFDAMDRTEHIRRDCRVLMAGEDGPTQAGLDVMATTSAQLEAGYEKILRWCLFEFRELGREMHVEVVPIMREAVRRIRKRPELLSEVLATLSKARHATLHTAFLTALTRGPPRPIELHAHDPLRYVGDMLAWVHQAIAAEREFLEDLFGLKADKRMVGSVRTFGNERAEEEEWIAELMDGAVGGICGPLKARVHQTIRSQESSIISYKIANLLQFYGLTMRRTVGEDALLSKTIHELTDVAYKAFMDAIHAQGRALLRVSMDLDESDVTPPLAILDHCQILREIMTVYASSLDDDSSCPSPRRSDDSNDDQIAFETILDAMIDPALQMCDAAAEEKKRVKPKWDREVFGLNCLSYVQGVLEPFRFASKKRQSIQVVVDLKVEELMEQHYENIRRDAGIEDVIIACESSGSNQVLSRHPATEPAQLQLSLHKFSEWLSGQEVVHSPRLAQLAVQKLHTQVHRAALARLAHAYETVCTEVRLPENRYEAGSTLLGSERPFGQVHLLWQIFGLEEG